MTDHRPDTPEDSMRVYDNTDVAAQHRAMGDRVYSMESRPFATTKRRGIPATGPTKNYLARLLSELGEEPAPADITQTEASRAIDDAKVRVATARKLRASAGNAPAAAQSTAPAWELTEGAYLLDGKAVLVQRSRESKRLYAKVWDADTETFVYAKGVQYRLRAEHRATLEQLEAFGKAFGVCGECGRTLTRKDSIERGIGPICAAKF